MPNYNKCLTSFFYISACNFGTGCGHQHTGVDSSFRSNSNGELYQVLNVLLKKSYFYSKEYNVFSYFVVKYLHCFFLSIIKTILLIFGIYYCMYSLLLLMGRPP